MKTFIAFYGKVFFCFCDGDFEERFETFSEMKQFAKNNYKKEYHNDIYFAAFLYNSFYDTTEVIDSIKVCSKTTKKEYDIFIERINKVYVTNN